MTLRSTKPEPIHWVSLPAEIRIMILEEITHQKNPGWASCASVCKEWQFFIEKRNFHRLKLQQTCLSKFKRTIIRQRYLVHHIQIDIKLPKYTCKTCARGESLVWASRQRTIIKDAIWTLFSILSTWEPASDLTLELKAHSPSDSEHWFRNHDFAPNEDGTEAATSTQDGDCGEISSKWHDPKHGWVNGQRVKTPPWLTLSRFFQSGPIGLQKTFPQVNTVTCLIIPRQFRSWLHPLDVWRISGSLCRLERLVYEPLRLPWKSRRIVTDEDSLFLVQLLLPKAPKAPKSLLVFEDFNTESAALITRRHHQPAILQVDPDRNVDPRVGAAFASRSLDLEQLAVSYLLNAEDFFRACLLAWTWQNLRSLALTSQLLKPTGSRLETDALLFRAGVSALQMPKLRTLVLWNGGRGNAAAFIYRVHRGSATITWRGTWNL
ncbi:hypothetical protein V502_03631 [Pseudogymnoascus sp. VKM F-4520 (FW-2644)]|nr:hypothetical protein V502_03631 [Pseudogymnoascus sp. VKM F-4520 (FW-2644)]